MFAKQLKAIVWKELISELKSKELIGSMLVYCLLVIIIFAFAFEPGRVASRELLPGMIWITVTFAGILGLNRSFQGELENDTLTGLLLAPMDPAVIFYGKMLGNLFFLIIMELVAVPLLFVFFNLHLTGSLPHLVLVLFLGTVGFNTVGTFLAAMAANTRTSELLLPVILLPLIVPVIIAGVEATGAVLSGAGLAVYLGWLQLLGVYDLVFLVLPLVLFDYIVGV